MQIIVPITQQIALSEELSTAKKEDVANGNHLRMIKHRLLYYRRGGACESIIAKTIWRKFI